MAEDDEAAVISGTADEGETRPDRGGLKRERRDEREINRRRHEETPRGA